MRAFSRNAAVLLASWLGVFAGPAAASSEPQAEPCTLLVTLYNRPFDDEHDIPTVPLTSDANIVIRAAIREVVDGTCAFDEGQRLVFAIHSPSMTFGGYWFSDQDFFLMLRRSEQKVTGREWDLIGLDYPLSTHSPGDENFLLCRGHGRVVRVTVGTPSRKMIGPLTIFSGDRLQVSLSIFELYRARSQHEGLSYSIDYAGDLTSSPFKPPFRFEADKAEGMLEIGSTTFDLSCDWPADPDAAPVGSG